MGNEGVPTPEEVTAVASKSILDHFTDGDWAMWPIAGIGILVLVITVERFITLYVKTQFDKGTILNEVRTAIYSGRLFMSGQTMIHQIIQAGFQAFERSKKESEVQVAIDAAASKHFPEIEKRTPYLTILANIATLLGLLGTISGLIQSFAGAASADPSTKAALLAGGISAAMNCTAFGLIIAIPALLFYAFLQGRTQRIIDDVNEVVLDAMNFLISHKEKIGSSRSEK